jgi:hypothetical protein
MNTPVLKRQLITDTAGNPIGVILPFEEYALVEKFLERQLPTQHVADAMAMMEQAVHDPLFMSDLNETISAFSDVDAEWWEPSP